MNGECLSFENYYLMRETFAVDRDMIRRCMAACEPLAVEALSVYGQRVMWQGNLPVYPIITSPSDNGGWGHLMPMWFEPSERPVPFHTLDNWALFALVYKSSFGDSDETRGLINDAITAENLVRVVAGSNMLLPFLPSTQGRGTFFRHGMLPYLLAILWLGNETCSAWLRLHELGARRFVMTQSLAKRDNPIEFLRELEYNIFARLERNAVHDDEAVASFLSAEGTNSIGAPPLLGSYQRLFGAINLGISALAKSYADRPLVDWRSWIYQEISVPYRMADFGNQAIIDFIKNV